MFFIYQAALVLVLGGEFNRVISLLKGEKGRLELPIRARSVIPELCGKRQLRPRYA
jgi:hypothetical protein